MHVLNEPADKKRSRDEKEDGEKPGRPLGSHPDDFDMDSEEARSKKKKGKK